MILERTLARTRSGEVSEQDEFDSVAAIGRLVGGPLLTHNGDDFEVSIEDIRYRIEALEISQDTRNTWYSNINAFGVARSHVADPEKLRGAFLWITAWGGFMRQRNLVGRVAELLHLDDLEVNSEQSFRPF
jgi:hypothetical protein